MKLPQNYVYGRTSNPYQPYLRRPTHPLVIFSYEVMRLCTAMGIIALAFAVIVLASNAVK